MTNALLGGWEPEPDVPVPLGRAALLVNSNSYIAGWSDFGYPIYAEPNRNVALGNNFDPSQFDMANAASPSNRYFDPAAFSNPATASSAPAAGRGRSCVRRPAMYEDLGIMKRFTVGPVRAQFRFEC